MSLVCFGLALLTLLPAVRDSMGGEGVRDYARKVVGDMDIESAEAFRNERLGATINEYLEYTSASPYVVVPHLFRNALRSQNNRFAHEIVLAATRRTIDLIETGQSERQRGWVTAAWLRLYTRLVRIAVEESRLDVIRTTIGFAGDILEVHRETDPTWRSMIGWSEEVRQLADELGRVGDRPAARTFSRLIVDAQIDHLEVGAPPEATIPVMTPQENLNPPAEEFPEPGNQWTHVSQTYIRTLSALGDAANEDGHYHVADAAITALTGLGLEAIELDNLGPNQMQEVLQSAMTTVEELAIRRARGMEDGPARVTGLQFERFAERAIQDDHDYDHIPLVTWGRILTNLLLEDTVPTTDWRMFSGLLRQQATNVDSQSLDILHWGAAMMENSLGHLEERLLEDNLITDGLLEVSRTIGRVLDELPDGEEAREIRERYTGLAEQAIELANQAGGITETVVEWPGRPGLRETTDLIRSEFEDII